MNIQNGLNAYLSYLRDIFLPAGLHYFYPHPAMMNQTISMFSTACCAVALIGITLATLGRLKTQPYLCVGWLWFLGSLIPVIGLVHFGEQARADRYTYLPSIGITFAIVYAIADFTTRRVSLRPLAIAAGAASCVALAVISGILIPSWKSTDALVSRALEIQPDNYLALLMRAKDLRLANNIPAALKYAEEAVHASPKSNGAHIAYGMALEASGRLEEAFQEFQISSEIDPAEPEAWEGMGSVRDLQADRLTGKDPKGEIDFRQKASVNFAKAIQYNPDAVESREYLAFELARLGYIDAAIEQWEKLVKLKPDYVRGQGDLADALLMKGDYTGAAEHYRMAIAGKARKHEWESKLAYLVATDPQYSPADVQPMIAIARDAVDQTNEQDADALDAYAACLARVGVFDLAKDAAQKALARAQAVHDATLAKSIQKRLAKYEQFKPYLIGDDPKPASATQSTSRPVEPAAK